MRTRPLFLCLMLLASAAVKARGDGNITGRWSVTISIGGESLRGLALLKQTGAAVTGSIGVDERNQHPLDGTVDGNRVTLTTHPRTGRTVAFEKCYLTLRGEELTGTTEGGDLRETASIELERVKE